MGPSVIMRAIRASRLMLAMLAVLAASPVVAAGDATDAAPLFEQAISLARDGKTSEAIALLQQVVEREPRHAAANHALGAIFNAQGRYPEALSYAEAAVAADPRNGRYRYGRGVVLAEHGRFLEAVADFDLAVASNPNLAYPYLERSAALRSLGRREDARRDLERARKADPGLIWNHWYAAVADFLEGRYAEAATGFQRVAEKEKNFLAAPLWTVLAKAKVGHWPGNPAGEGSDWPSPVLVHFRGGIDSDQLIAIARQDRASGDARREAETYFFLAEKALAEGRVSEAERRLRQALALNTPRHAWRIAAERELDLLERRQR